MTISNPTTITDTIYAFLSEIGIAVKEQPIDEPTFLPGIKIQDGTLLVDPAKLLYPGDLLHEAGHIAVTPATDRLTLSGNITEGHPEKEGEEMAVLLWSYAACRHLNIPLPVLFHPDGYKGQSQWLIDLFEGGTYMGLPLLVWMGLTTNDTFPTLTRWLRA